MANFKDSFKKVILAEGGYVNDPDDSGGETYLGITRVHEPNAKMWTKIDAVKKANPGFTNKIMTNLLNKDESILDEARSIYKKKYWDAVKLDTLNNQKLAHQIFDHAVNAGVSASIKLAQELVGMKATGTYSNTLTIKLNNYANK